MCCVNISLGDFWNSQYLPYIFNNFNTKTKKLVILLPVDFWCHLQTVLQLIANAQNICNLIGLTDHIGLIILLISILHSLTKKLQHSLFLETVESTRFLPLKNIATTAEKLLRRVGV